MATEKRAATPATERPRSKAPSLTEKDIVNAALEVIRSEGVEALSMRRLSRELDRSAMAPYWHVADKQELLDLVAREVLSEVEIPASDTGTWEDRLRAIVASIDARLRAHPGIADVLFARMQSTDRRLILGIMGILMDAGFSDADVLLGYAMVHTYLFGRYQVVTRAEWDEPAADTPTAGQGLLRLRRGHDHRRLARQAGRHQRQQDSLSQGGSLARVKRRPRFNVPRQDRAR
jgi:TetR/AcrR family tetracycline transcriptional repressor